MSFLDRLIGRPQAARKAVYGGPIAATYARDLPLSYLGNDPHTRMAAYLAAYKVGWFFKAGRKISGDVAGLARTLAYEDTEGDNAEEIVARALNVPFESLDPLEQFLRLMERPNPSYTGRTLFTKTQIRLDFAGLAFWYLENGDGGDLPTAIYGISPTRMTPSLDKAGQLLGWVLDADDRGGGTPFTTEEILPFVVPAEVDDPWCGQGVVEAVYGHVPLTQALTRHTGDVLATGGRLAGMLWPKERTLDEAEFLDAQRAWRNTTSDPNAARRLLIFPEPMEYAQGAATPAEIGIPELANLSRDDILTAFPISPHILQVPLSGAGLNSGDSLESVRGEYWEGSIHPRVELLEETIQWGLVARYENAIGRPLDFDIEEPNLDDAASLTAKAEAFKGLVSIGFEPKEAVAAVGLDHIKWLGLPEMLDPAKQAAAQQAQLEALANQPAPDPNQPEPPPAAPKPQPTKAESVKARREDTIGRELPGFQTVMQTFLDDQAKRLAVEIERVLGPMTKTARKALPDDWWDRQREDAYLRDHLRPLYVRLARTALQVVADHTDRLVYNRQVAHIVDQMLAKAATRITGINETTRAAVQQQIEEGVRRGYSIPQIVNGVTHEGFGGVKTLPAFDEARAELVARTETMLAYNESAIRGYAEFGVEQVEAIDGDNDEECAARDGQTFSVEEALDIEDHPNGTLDWIPLTDKAWHEPDHMGEALKALTAFATREQPAPVVTVTTPLSVPVTVNVPEQTAPVVNVSTPDTVVNVPEQAAPVVTVITPDVTVNVPEQATPTVNVTTPEVVVNVPELVTINEAPVVNVAAPEVHIDQPAPVVVNEAPIVNVTVPKPTTRTIKRDKQGQIVSITDGD